MVVILKAAANFNWALAMCSVLVLYASAVISASHATIHEM